MERDATTFIITWSLLDRHRHHWFRVEMSHTEAAFSVFCLIKTTSRQACFLVESTETSDTITARRMTNRTILCVFAYNPVHLRNGRIKL